MIFPTIVYKSPGLHRGPKGTSFAYKGVADEDAFLEALDDGWHETLAGALSGDKVIREVAEAQEAIDEISPATRDELEQKAKELGVPFNARTKDEVLTERIAEAMGDD